MRWVALPAEPGGRLRACFLGPASWETTRMPRARLVWYLSAQVSLQRKHTASGGQQRVPLGAPRALSWAPG